MFFDFDFLIEPELTDASLNSETFYEFQKPYNNTGDDNWYPATMAPTLKWAEGEKRIWKLWDKVTQCSRNWVSQDWQLIFPVSFGNTR